MPQAVLAYLPDKSFERADKAKRNIKIGILGFGNIEHFGFRKDIDTGFFFNVVRRDFSGDVFVISSFVKTDICLLDGVVGLNCLIPIFSLPF